jgi:hypothetical protein
MIKLGLLERSNTISTYYLEAQAWLRQRDTEMV